MRIIIIEKFLLINFWSLSGAWKIKLLPDKQFFSNISTLSLGAISAQLLGILITPLLTRLYSPDDFGLLSVFSSVVAVTAVVAMGRYELTILKEPAPINMTLFMVSIKAAFYASLTLIILMLFFKGEISILLKNPELESWLLFAPLGIFSANIFAALQLLQNSTNSYKGMSIDRVFSAGSNALLALGIGLISGAFNGMIISLVLAPLLVSMRRLKLYAKELEGVFSFKWSAQEALWARHYKEYPTKVAPSHLVGVSAQHLPFIFIGTAFSPEVLGLFYLAYRLISMPTTLVANAVGSVYFKSISDRYQAGKTFTDICLSMTTTTFLMALIPFSLIFIFSPVLFDWIFGSEWIAAGEYARILTLSAFFQFICTPLDKTCVVVNATRYIFFLQCARLFLMILLVLIVNFNQSDIITALWLFAAFEAAIYLFDLAASFYFSGKYFARLPDIKK